MCQSNSCGLICISTKNMAGPVYIYIYIYITWNKGDNSFLFLHLFPACRQFLGSTVLCRSSLGRAQGILDGIHCLYQGHNDMLVCLIRCPTVTWVSLLVEIGESGCLRGTSLAETVGLGSALDMVRT